MAMKMLLLFKLFLALAIFLPGADTLQVQSVRVPNPAAPRGWANLKNYRLGPIIGRGSYGQVAQATDLRSGKKVAIKRVDHVFDDRVDAQRRIREVAILLRMNSNFIVKILDVIVPGSLVHFNEFYIVLEFADSDLKKVMDQPQHLSDHHIQHIMYQMLLGLHHLHSAGILHRDIKPGNILMNTNCDVKLCDFGLSCCTGARPDRKSGLVQPGQHLEPHVVTRWYRSPELLVKDTLYNSQIDMWAVGCVFGELLQMMERVCPRRSDRGALFPGATAYPISPDPRFRDPSAHKTEANHARSGREMMNKIISLIGKPSESDISHLRSSEAQRYIRRFEDVSPCFDETFRRLDPTAKDLLRRMLTFDVRSRITIREALGHHYFDRVRHEIPLEKVPKDPVVLELENDRTLTMKKLRYLFLLDYKRIHPEINIPESLKPK